MTEAKKIIKEAGLTVKPLSIFGTVYSNPVTGRTSKAAAAMFNKAGEIFCIDGKPYTPIGGARAFAELITGGLDQPGFSFQAFTIDSY